tara:strand:+ start:1096 stop:1644 length:549 start_codon:yes stop_codon:yes gene_type:complete
MVSTLTETAAEERIPAIDALRASFGALESLANDVAAAQTDTDHDAVKHAARTILQDQERNQERLANGVFDPAPLLGNTAVEVAPPSPYYDNDLVEVPLTAETIDVAKLILAKLIEGAKHLASLPLPGRPVDMKPHLEAIEAMHYRIERTRDNLACMLNSQRRLERQKLEQRVRDVQGQGSTS